MYHRDVPEIVRYVDEVGPDGVVDVITFVLCTIRMPFYRTKDMMYRIRSGDYSPLFSFKKKGYDYTVEHKASLFEDRTLENYLKVPGLGLAKASFALQCLGEPYGCLDSHNLKELGVSNSKKLRLEHYLELMSTKSTEQWWNDWCNMIPNTRHNKGRFKDGDEVSQFHLECIRRSLINV